MTAESERLRQLVQEAVAALDPSDPDHGNIDHREWVRTARATLAEHDADGGHPRLRRRSS